MDLVTPGWERVADAFARNFVDGGEVGAGVCVYHRGEQVVNLYGGTFAADSSRPYDHSTLQLVFSTTKGITAIAVAMCVERGLIDYDQPVARYWPEFAEHGKSDITVAQLLSHQAGLICPDRVLSLAEALDWSTICAALADTTPDWSAGTMHGYHAVTFGWLAGELIRRTDGRSVGRFVADEIAGPLGVEFFIGLPDELEQRVSPLIGNSLGDSADPAVKAMVDMFLGPTTRTGRALFLGDTFRGDDVFNRRDVHAAEIPAANGITNAASLARIYAATLQPIDGVQLCGAAVRDRASTTITRRGGVDACLMTNTTFGMGFMTNGSFTPYAGETSFGHPGAGGSVGFAQPSRHLAFGYTMNRMADNLAGDARAQRLIDAAAQSADAMGDGSA